MTDDVRSSGPRAGARMNRMMSNGYEKRGMTTAHLRLAVADRAGQGQPTTTPPASPAEVQPKPPRSDG